MPFMPDVYMLALLRWNPDEVQSCLEEAEEFFFFKFTSQGDFFSRRKGKTLPWPMRGQRGLGY